MGPALGKLIEIGSAPICAEAISPVSDALLSGRLGAQLRELLQRKNGFYAFEAALHVFPLCAEAYVLDLAAWNSSNLWRQYYGPLSEGCLFFAENVFGFQFVIKDDLVWSFDSETGKLTEIGESLEDWAATILNDCEFQTGHRFAHEWQASNRLLKPNERLFPLHPFVLGGKYEVSNLIVSNAVYGMQFRGCVAQQIKDLPEGAKVESVFTPPG